MSHFFFYLKNKYQIVIFLSLVNYCGIFLKFSHFFYLFIAVTAINIKQNIESTQIILEP